MNTHRQSLRSVSRYCQRGVSLIELMVAMTIGAVLIFGATQVYVNSRNAYGANEGVSRLQETARYAVSVIEPDVRMSTSGDCSRALALSPARRCRPPRLPRWPLAPRRISAEPILPST